MHDEESVTADSVTEVEEQVQQAPQPSTLPIIMHLLYKAAGVVLCLWLSSPLWLPPVKATLGWATQYLQYLAAFTLVATILTHIPYCLPIPTICAWAAHCTCPISLVTRCHAGLEWHFIKPALMPVSLLAAEHLLACLMMWESDTGLHFGLACIGLLLAYFFSWRDDSLMPLAKSDIVFTGRVLWFSERFSKGSFTNFHHLYHRLEMDLACSPALAAA